MSSIDIENEELLTITQAAKRCPARPHVATMWRWVLNGLDGVKLDSIKVGGKRLTSAEAISRFIAATTAQASGEPLPSRSPKQRERAVEQAERELAAAGV